MNQIKWFDRNFQFGQQNIFPSIIERLWGSPILYQEKLKDIPLSILINRHEDKWSILDNIGHLIDLETLWQGRLKDIKDGKKYLREADLSNAKTHAAEHYKKDPKLLLDEFYLIRKKTIQELTLLTEELIFKSSLHPRLKVPMRTMDLFLFVAEHDDHHLVRISYILGKLIS